MDITLTTINTKLYQLDEEYAKTLPEYKVLELEYIRKFDDLMINAQTMFTNQPSREAYARREIMEWDKYDKYCSLQVKVNLLTTRMRNYQIISKNLVSASWSAS